MDYLEKKEVHYEVTHWAINKINNNEWVEYNPDKQLGNFGINNSYFVIDNDGNIWRSGYNLGKPPEDLQKKIKEADIDKFGRTPMYNKSEEKDDGSEKKDKNKDEEDDDGDESFLQEDEEDKCFGGMEETFPGSSSGANAPIEATLYGEKIDTTGRFDETSGNYNATMKFIQEVQAAGDAHPASGKLNSYLINHQYNDIFAMAMDYNGIQYNNHKWLGTSFEDHT